MAKSLVIVESPAKAKTINKYLGNDYVVRSSVGHIRDLPTSGAAKIESKPAARGKAVKADKAEAARSALFRRMGVDPQNGWNAQYEILPGKEKVVAELKKLAADCDQIYLATDLDREGEAIAWHLQQVIGGAPERFRRVTFNEITKNAIRDAFSQPGMLNIDRVNAQQTRRFLDRVVGYMVSPLLWKKITRGLSAGRVQSVAVRLIVEREREIKAFTPEEYWSIAAHTLTAASQPLLLDVSRYRDKALSLTNKAAAEAAVAALKPSAFTVISREAKPSTSRPPAPLITSTLQQAASNRLGYSVKKTMTLAQRLYEAGHITYMRTDSTNLSRDAIDSVRGYIGKHYPAGSLPESPNFYSSKEGAQEAHEAIRPTDVNQTGDKLGDMEADARKLYDLIWRQFVACQMTPAQYDATRIVVKAGDYELVATGRTLRFAGWTAVLKPLVKKEEVELPLVKEGESLKLQQLDPQQHFTKPPARYSEATLVRELEKRGIGRPSTYAAIISTIQERGYVRVESRRFYAEKMGEVVNDRLVENFSELMNFDFTAQMEETLDGIASGQQNWKGVLDQFYRGFVTQLDKAELPQEEGGMRRNEAVVTNIPCAACGRPMALRTATTGVFLGCTGYSLPPAERCATTVNLTAEALKAVKADDEEVEAHQLVARRRCGKCGTAMDAYLVDNHRRLHVCGRSPSCDGTELETGDFVMPGQTGPEIDCDRCGSKMLMRNGRFGKFYGCTNEACKNTRKLLKNGQPAPPREDPVPLPELKCSKSDAYFILREGAAGVFLAAHNFPKSRETRAPLVAELKRFRDRLPPKLQYLADAPEKDPAGHATVVKFSRKSKEQYVASEADGKATGWSAFYSGGRWKVAEK